MHSRSGRSLASACSTLRGLFRVAAAVDARYHRGATRSSTCPVIRWLITIAVSTRPTEVPAKSDVPAREPKLGGYKTPGALNVGSPKSIRAPVELLIGSPIPAFTIELLMPGGVFGPLERRSSNAALSYVPDSMLSERSCAAATSWSLAFIVARSRSWSVRGSFGNSLGSFSKS
jgi:hypothetical protein